VLLGECSSPLRFVWARSPLNGAKLLTCIAFGMYNGCVGVVLGEIPFPLRLVWARLAFPFPLIWTLDKGAKMLKWRVPLDMYHGCGGAEERESPPFSPLRLIWARP
jgi:hypothetical protein